MIQFWNVSKKYPAGPTALADVSFSIARGEFVFLTGPSGAGKTTLLKLIYREELPDAGQIVVNGRNVTALPRRKIPYLRRSIGVVFQSFRLIARKTVFENVTYLPRILGMSRAEQQRMCERALRRVGLAHRLNAYPRQLSGGEQQRVTLARALVCDPRIILADEPTGNLDPELSAEILALLREIHAQGTTVIVATHDRAIIESLGGRVLLLHRGRLVADGYREPVAVEPPPYAAAVAAAVAEAAPRRARPDDVRRRLAEGTLRFYQALSYFVSEACRLAGAELEGERRGHRGHRRQPVPVRRVPGSVPQPVAHGGAVAAGGGGGGLPAARRRAGAGRGPALRARRAGLGARAWSRSTPRRRPAASRRPSRGSPSWRAPAKATSSRRRSRPRSIPRPSTTRSSSSGSRACGLIPRR